MGVQAWGAGGAMWPFIRLAVASSLPPPASCCFAPTDTHSHIPSVGVQATADWSLSVCVCACAYTPAVNQICISNRSAGPRVTAQVQCYLHIELCEDSPESLYCWRSSRTGTLEMASELQTLPVPFLWCARETWTSKQARRKKT